LLFISLGLFALAQIAYAVVFMGIYSRNRAEPIDQLMNFIYVLPFSQLVPLFIWLESFHFAKVDAFLSYFELCPTERECIETESEEERNGGISSTYVTRMILSNCGFILEALVEAIPQCLVQTAALVHFAEADPLICLSILTSIFVIVTKCYMLSVSYEKRIFIFNAMCIQGDVTGLFATIIWTYGQCSGSNGDSRYLYEMFSENVQHVLFYVPLARWHGSAFTCTHPVIMRLRLY